jgi:drug/metabolite transporter (DMT)-like permease
MTRGRAILLLTISVLFFSTSGVLVKLSSWNALALTGGRSLIAGLVILAYLRKPRFTWSSVQIGGAVAYVGTQVFFVAATQMTSAANAILLQYTAPIWVAVFGIWFLGEKPKRIDWITMAAIGVGMALFFNEGLSRSGYLGNMYAILSGVSLAWLVLFLRKQAGESTLETILLGNALAAMIGIPFMLPSSPDTLDWGILFFLGVFQLGLPFILYTQAIRYLSAVETILVQSLEPILNPIWVYMTIGELPSPQALLGGLIVLISITTRAVITAVGGRRRLQRTSPVQVSTGD